MKCQVPEQLKVNGNDDSHHLSLGTLYLFTGKEMGSHGLNNLPKFTQLVNVRDEANIWSQIRWAPIPTTPCKMT